MEAELHLLGLTRRDANLLREEVPEVIIHVPENRSSTSHGEPVSISVIVAAGSIAAVAMWLAKNRKKTTINYKIEVIKPDGSSIKQDLAFEASESASTKESAKAFEDVLSSTLELSKNAG